MNELNTILPYIIGVNIITYTLMGVDKQKARKHKYRIPERTFWLLAIAGGALGALIGMKVYRHKTKHRSFTVGMPAILFVHLILLIFLS
ncbi:DUF1294 domain-containing protein [Virgibacillus sp. C22-A2]|uniref:DUF1294 domain-containing protein n=1 Tax=Virgibacillus tibetensis TaxID=3042313 RepID=A0ABU6KAA2_9BACI|nr:DUF1294 domain-containing protein [Virgibacillus sp. C22-A2]